MSFPRFVPAVLFALVSAAGQTPTNAVNVDQVITLQANLSSLNETPPIVAPPPTGVPAGEFNAISTATARVTIRFIGANSTNVNPVTGIPLPITGTTANLSRATLAVSLSTVFVNSDRINTIRIERAPDTTGTSGPTTNPSVFDFTLPTATVIVGSGIQNNLLSHQFEVTNAAQLAILREVASNPAGFYINILTTAGPNGMVRGQLRRAGDTADEVTGNRLDVVTLLVVRMAYTDGLITAAERDSYLVNVPTQPSGSTGN